MLSTDRTEPELQEAVWLGKVIAKVLDAPAQLSEEEGNVAGIGHLVGKLKVSVLVTGIARLFPDIPITGAPPFGIRMSTCSPDNDKAGLEVLARC